MVTSSGLTLDEATLLTNQSNGLAERNLLHTWKAVEDLLLTAMTSFSTAEPLRSQTTTLNINYPNLPILLISGRSYLVLQINF